MLQTRFIFFYFYVLLFVFLFLIKIKVRGYKECFIMRREYFHIKLKKFVNKFYQIEFVIKFINNYKTSADKFDKEFLDAIKKVDNKELDDNKIIKQNKVLTKTEILSLALSMKGNKSVIYTALNSYLPIFLTGGLFGSLILLVALFFRDVKISSSFPLLIFIIGSIICIAFWFSVFYTEKKSGKHVDMLKRNILQGFYIFLFTEVLCFLALFWTFFHSTLSASIHVGIFNPGEGIVNFFVSDSFLLKKNWDLYCYHTWGTPGYYNISNVFSLSDAELWKYNKVKVHTNLFDSGVLVNPWGLPVLNTLILLSSAAILNAGHCYITLSKFFKCLITLIITIFFGVLFVIFQFIEYLNCAMSFNDGIFAACFLGTTGLHGIHVILGIFALYICLMNFLNKNYTPNFHQTFYFSIFYWHFVDVVWILVWFCIYLWPGSYFFTENYVSCYDYNFFIYNLNTNYFVNILDYNFNYNSRIFDKTILKKNDDSIKNIFLLFKNNVNTEIYQKEYCSDYLNDIEKNKKKKFILDFFQRYILFEKHIFLEQNEQLHSYEPESFKKPFISKNIWNKFALEDYKNSIIASREYLMELCFEYENYLIKNSIIASRKYLMELCFEYQNASSYVIDIEIMKNNLSISIDYLNYLLELEKNYILFLYNFKSFNFNELKTGLEFVCWFRTEVHKELENIVYCPAFEDLKNKIYRISIYLLLRNLENNFMTWAYCNLLFSPWYFLFVK